MRALKAEIEAISKLPINDQFFEIKFRPSLDWTEFGKQVAAFNAISGKVKNVESKLPREVASVFKANNKKLALIKKHGINSAEQICEEIEKNLLTKVSPDNYKAMKYSEVEALANQKETVHVDLTEHKTISPCQCL